MNSKGFSTIEVLLASSILILIVTAFMGAFVYGSESTALAGQRARAVFLAEEGLEASRNIRDASFSNLSDGTTGLAISGNQWIFSGSSDTTDGFYTRQITISTIDSNRKQIISTVTWQQNPQRTGSVSLITYLTNWQGSLTPTTCNAYAQSQGYSSGTCRQNANQCTNNGETHLTGGDAFCTGGSSADTCCALSTPTPTPATCNEYCISLGTYVQGTCRKGVPQCNANGETHESGGNNLCQQAEGGICCCLP